MKNIKGGILKQSTNALKRLILAFYLQNILFSLNSFLFNERKGQINRIEFI